MPNVKEYEEYLNTLSGEIPPDAWNIGGKVRDEYKERNEFGTALRVYDLETFSLRFEAWRKRELNKPKNLK